MQRYVTDDFSPFLHTHSVPVVVVLRFWDSSQDLSQECSSYRLVDVVPAHNAVIFHLARHCFVGSIVHLMCVRLL